MIVEIPARRRWISVTSSGSWRTATRLSGGAPIAAEQSAGAFDDRGDEAGARCRGIDECRGCEPHCDEHRDNGALQSGRQEAASEHDPERNRGHPCADHRIQQEFEHDEPCGVGRGQAAARAAGQARGKT